MALMSKNKLHFVDGSIIAPDKNDPLFGTWERCNNMMLSWLLHSLFPSIAQSVIWLDWTSDEKIFMIDFHKIANAIDADVVEPCLHQGNFKRMTM